MENAIQTVSSAILNYVKHPLIAIASIFSVLIIVTAILVVFEIKKQR